MPKKTMSRPFYFITCQWREAVLRDPNDIVNTKSSLAAARKEKKALQKQSDESAGEEGEKEIFRIFKVKEVS